MIIYEVNVTINNDIFNEYTSWLIEHIKIMLQFKGFRKADILKEKTAENDAKTTRLTVHYFLESEQDLDDYLNTHAKAMREDGIKKFGNQFSAFRRVFSIINQY